MFGVGVATLRRASEVRNNPAKSTKYENKNFLVLQNTNHHDSVGSVLNLFPEIW